MSDLHIHFSIEHLTFIALRDRMLVSKTCSEWPGMPCTGLGVFARLKCYETQLAVKPVS
jgi:hypothetical protein